MKRMNEISRKDFISNTDKRSKRNSKEVGNPIYVGITRKYTITMKVPSASANGTFYTVKIRLVEMPDMMKMEDLTMQERVRLALIGDVAISCTCPAYLYWGYKYIMTQLGSNVGRGENREPIIRNPKLEGTLCKHGYKSVKVLGKYWKRIASDIEKKNFI